MPFRAAYNRRIQTGLILLAIIGTSLAHYFTSPSLILWHNIFQRLYYLPIIYAAVRFGWVGGLETAALAGITPERNRRWSRCTICLDRFVTHECI